MLQQPFPIDRRRFLTAATSAAVLSACASTEPPGPECDPPSVSGVDWIPDVAHPVAWGEEHLTEADGAPRTMTIYYPSPRFIPPRPMLRSCIGRWPIALLLHGQPPQGASGASYHSSFSRISVGLARSGYVVVAPLHSVAPPTRDNAPAMIEAAMRDIDWVRTNWREAKWTARAGSPVTVIGHSYGAVQAARIAAGAPNIGALVSLSGPYLDFNDREPLFRSIRCPSFFMFSDDISYDFQNVPDWIEGNPAADSNPWRLLPGDRYAAIYSGAHFDYLDDAAAGLAPRGPCSSLISQLAADLTARFVSANIRSLTRVPFDLSKPLAQLSPAQENLAIQHLPAIDKLWGENCRIRLKWRVGGVEGARTLAG